MPTRKPRMPTDPIFAEMQQQQFGSIADAQRWLDARMHAYNDAPQAELAGLSPNQMHRLLSTDWSDFSVTRLARDLTLADVEGSAWFQGARALIRAVDARGGILPDGAAEAGVLEELDQEVVAATSGLGLETVPVIAGEAVDHLPVEDRCAPMAMLVLQPLVQLGLLEGRATPRSRVADFRRTPLFTRLLRFDWSAPQWGA